MGSLICSLDQGHEESLVRTAVTGYKGMVGRHMAMILEEQGIDCLYVGREEWDLTKWKSSSELDEIFCNVDVIFHFGAALPESTTDVDSRSTHIQYMFDANVRSCVNLSEWALLRGVSLVFLSGATVYKNPHGTKITEDSEKVVNGFGGFYGYTKLLAEHVLSHFMDSGLKAVILRPSSIYGEGLGNDKLISSYLRLALHNELLIVDEPYNRINLIHALDVANAALMAYMKNAWGVYNIAADFAPTIKEIAEVSIQVCRGGSLVLNESVDDESGFLRFDLDTTKAKSTFEFQNSISLEEGITMMKSMLEEEC